MTFIPEPVIFSSMHQRCPKITNFTVLIITISFLLLREIAQVTAFPFIVSYPDSPQVKVLVIAIPQHD